MYLTSCEHVEKNGRNKTPAKKDGNYSLAISSDKGESTKSTKMRIKLGKWRLQKKPGGSLKARTIQTTMSTFERQSWKKLRN